MLSTEESQYIINLIVQNNAQMIEEHNRQDYPEEGIEQLNEHLKLSESEQST